VWAGGFYTPLHQAAWHGASVAVVERLLAQGAWRTVTTADGLPALHIAMARRHVHLLEHLSPTPRSRDRLEETRALDERLQEVIDSRVRPEFTGRLR
jgi:ankyrin repeat protein